jgi:hypothetical protein
LSQVIGAGEEKTLKVANPNQGPWILVWSLELKKSSVITPTHWNHHTPQCFVYLLQQNKGQYEEDELLYGKLSPLIEPWRG